MHLVIVHLQVRHVNVNPRSSADGKHFLNGGVDLQTLVAHMAGDQTVKFLDHLAQLPQLLRTGEKAGRIFQAQGQAPGAILQILPQKRLHLLQFFSGHLPVLIADGSRPQAAVAHQNGLVDRHLIVGSLEFLYKRVKGLAIPVVLFTQIGRGLFHAFGQRREGAGAALTGHLGGDALIQLGSTAAVPQERCVGMGMGVDEAGGNHQTGSIQHLLGLQPAQIAHRGDFSVLYCHICLKSGLAGAVNDRAAANDNIFHKTQPPWHGKTLTFLL